MPPLSQIMYEESVFAGGIVVVKVGRAKRETLVHERLLRSRSPYFRSILTNRDDKTTTISLLDTDADTFCAFLSWLYSNCFSLPKDNEWMNLCKLWLLAERFKVPTLQNQVVGVFSSRLYQRKVARLDLEIFHYVYDNTGPGSKLRMLFIHASIWYGNQDVFAKMAKDMPPVFFVDYASQEADKAHKLREEVPIDAWDLTEYLLSEVSTGGGMEMAKADVDLDEEYAPKRRSGSPVVERQTKRKRPSDAGAPFDKPFRGTHLPE